VLVIAPIVDSVKKVSDTLRSAGYQIQVTQDRLAASSSDACVAIVVTPVTGDRFSKSMKFVPRLNGKVRLFLLRRWAQVFWRSNSDSLHSSYMTT
jgi:hypothetical protein